MAGPIILRQRPGTAKGVFLTPEDETGTVNITVRRRLHEDFRRAVGTEEINGIPAPLHTLAVADCTLSRPGETG